MFGFGRKKKQVVVTPVAAETAEKVTRTRTTATKPATTRRKKATSAKTTTRKSAKTTRQAKNTAKAAVKTTRQRKRALTPESQERQNLIIKEIMAGNNTHKLLVDVTGMNTHTMTYWLQRLTERKVLHKVPHGPHTYYRVNPRYRNV